MKEMLMNILTGLLYMLTASALAFAAQWIHSKCQDIKQKTKNEALKMFIDKFDHIIRICVEATNQTFVDNLKDNNAFTDEQKTEAFKQTFDAVDLMLTDEDKQQIIESFGDVGNFVKVSIENYIKMSKEV